MPGRFRVRRLVGASVASIAVLALGACAPGPSATDASAAGSKKIDMSGFAGQKLDYLYFTDGPDEQATRDLITGFEQATGATVELQVVPFADLDKQLQTRLAGKTPPSVARVAHWQPYADALVDMKTYFGAGYATQFVDGAAAASQTRDGRMLAVPNDLTINGPLINLDAFAKAGISPPTADRPWTWDSMIASATAVQKANNMESAIAIDKSGHRLSTVLSQFGTQMIGPDGKEGLEADKAEKAIDTLDGLVRSGAMLKDFWLESGSRYKDAADQFLAGQAPIYFSGNWQVARLAKTAKFAWTAVANPCAERCGGFPGGKYMVAFSGSKNPDLGAAFVEWMNRADAQRAIDEKAFWIPTRKDLVASGVAYPQRAVDMSVFVADIARTPTATYATNGSPAFDAAAKVLVEQVSKQFAGQQDTAATVAALKAGVADAVRKTQ